MVKITMVGHATLIFSFGDVNILSDPCFSERMSFPRIVNPYRRYPLKITPESLPRIDVIVCTHRHPDHFEIASLKRMDKNSTVLVPEQRMVNKLTRIGFKHVVCIETWEEINVSGITVVATPAIEGTHGIPQVGYILAGKGRSVYFGGDTMPFPEIEEIGRKFTIDVALPPINGVRLFGKQADMTPEDAADAVVKMNAKVAIPQHCDLLFGFPGSLYYKAPGTPEKFAESVAKKASSIDVHILGPGDTVEV